MFELGIYRIKRTHCIVRQKQFMQFTSFKKSIGENFYCTCVYTREQQIVLSEFRLPLTRHTKRCSHFNNTVNRHFTIFMRCVSHLKTTTIKQPPPPPPGNRAEQIICTRHSPFKLKITKKQNISECSFDSCQQLQVALNQNLHRFSLLFSTPK